MDLLQEKEMQINKKQGNIWKPWIQTDGLEECAL